MLVLMVVMLTGVVIAGAVAVVGCCGDIADFSFLLVVGWLVL